MEEVVLKRIDEISGNEILLQGIVSSVSGEAGKKVSGLEDKRVLLKFRSAELDKKGRRFANKLVEIKGASAEGFILKEIKEIDQEMKGLEDELKRIEFEIDRWRDFF